MAIASTIHHRMTFEGSLITEGKIEFPGYTMLREMNPSLPVEPEFQVARAAMA